MTSAKIRVERAHGSASRHVIKLVCAPCSRGVGTATVDVWARIMIPLKELRCDQCGGQPIVGEMFRQSVYPGLPRSRATVEHRQFAERRGWLTGWAHRRKPIGGWPETLPPDQWDRPCPAARHECRN
jgi:hypothetical protein